MARTAIRGSIEVDVFRDAQVAERLEVRGSQLVELDLQL